MTTTPAPLSPDAEAMAEHLNHLFGGDLGGHHEGLVEIAWTDPSGAPNHAKLFETSDLEEAVELAAEKNAVEGTNIYVGAALRQPSSAKSKRCSDWRTPVLRPVPRIPVWSDSVRAAS